MKSWSLDIDEGIATIGYSGPQHALSFAGVTELANLLESLARSTREVSLVVLSGGGGDQFLPDADREELERLIVPGPVVGDVLAWHRVTVALGSLPQPTVAAIDCSAASGGLLFALACTFRVASERAMLGPVQLNLGVVGTDSACHLARLVGPSIAADLLMTGRQLPAGDAKQIGLLNEVFPVDGFSGHVREWCSPIGKTAPGVVLAIKEAVVQRPFISRQQVDPVLEGLGLLGALSRAGCNC